MFQTRQEFIAYTTARMVTHLKGASAQDHDSAVASAVTLANILERLGHAPWPYVAVQPQAVTPTAPQTQGVAPQAADNAARLLAAVQQTQQAPIGSPQNPASSGAIIASNGEAQSARVTETPTVVSPMGIVPPFQNPPPAPLQG